MTVYYVRSTDGNNADSGLTWALAKATLAGAAAVATGGDTVWVSQVHAESQGSAMTNTFTGTFGSPIKIICGNDGAEPPTATATTATVTVTVGNFALTNVGDFHCYGITFVNATTTNTQGIFLSVRTDITQIYEDCSFQLTGGSGTTKLSFGSTNNEAGGVVIFRNCTYKHATTGAGGIQLNGVKWDWIGGSVLATTNVYNVICRSATNVGRAYKAEIRGVNLANIPAASNLSSSNDPGGSIRYINCKAPASWSGTVAAGTLTAGARAEAINFDNANTVGRHLIDDSIGTIRPETTIVLTGGSSDGMTGTAYSYKMVANSNAQFWRPLVSQTIEFPNTTTGSAVVVTVHVVHSGIGAGTGGHLTNAQAWLDGEYAGTSGYPLDVPISDRKTTFLTASADQTTSTASWTSPPATPVYDELSFSVTPSEKGTIKARVCLAIAGTIYFDYWASAH